MPQKMAATTISAMTQFAQLKVQQRSQCARISIWIVMFLLLFFGLPLFVLFNVIISSNAGYLRDSYPADVIEDATLDTVQLLQKYNYPAQTHYVTTSDGYILRVHRIARTQTQAPVVFLMHGLLDSSATWIEMGPWAGLGYYLYDNGYDVWLGNARGNRYSRNHTTYNPDVDKSFWQFSWHEIGYYDLPAMIDYVLETTGATKLSYFGHSQGTTSFWVLCSTRPEYNEKVIIMHALAPVAFMKHAKTIFVPFSEYLLLLSRDMLTEFLPNTQILSFFCLQSKIILGTCMDIFWQIMGRNPQQLNATMLPVIYGHLPAGCSANQLRHYIQLVSSNRFCKYDYGFEENIRRYQQPLPPDYLLGKVTTAVALYYAKNDYLSSVEDVQRLAKMLPNVVEDYLYPYNKWNHMAMLWGMDARKLAHKRMLKILRTYNKNVKVHGDGTKLKPELEEPTVTTTAPVRNVTTEEEPVPTKVTASAEGITEAVSNAEVETVLVSVSTEENTLADTTRDVVPTTTDAITESVMEVDAVTMPVSAEATGTMVPETEVEPLPEIDVTAITAAATDLVSEGNPAPVPTPTDATAAAPTALEKTEPDQNKAQPTEVDQLELPEQLEVKVVRET